MKEKTKRILLVAGAAVLGAAALTLVWSTGEGAGVGIPCMLHALTGLYCPGCGASRALRSVLHLDFGQAMHYNSMFTLMLPLVAAYFAALAVSYIRSGRDMVTRRIPSKPLWWIIGAMMLFGVMRNLPWFAFLAPATIS